MVSLLAFHLHLYLDFTKESCILVPCIAIPCLLSTWLSRELARGPQNSVHCGPLLLVVNLACIITMFHR